MQPTKKKPGVKMSAEDLTFFTSVMQLRKDHDLLNQKKFADAIGVDLNKVKNWDRRLCLPKLQELLFIASYFGTTIEELSRETKEDSVLKIA